MVPILGGIFIFRGGIPRPAPFARTLIIALIIALTDPANAPTFFPFVLDCHQFYELMVAQGEERSPMTSSDAETDSKSIIIILNLRRSIVIAALKSSFSIYCNRNNAAMDAA